MKLASITLRNGKLVVDRRVDGLEVSFDIPPETFDALSKEAALMAKAREAVRNAWAEIRRRHDHLRRPVNSTSWIERKCQTVVCGLRIREKCRKPQSHKNRRRRRLSLEHMFRMEHDKVRNAWKSWNRRQCWIVRKCESVVHNMKVRLQLTKAQVASVRETISLFKDVQAGACNLTGEILDEHNAECDHKIPVSRGGPSTIDNLQWITGEVHAAKGRMTNEEFIEMCRKVVAHADRAIDANEP